MRGVTVEVTANLVTETCCRAGCGVLFAMPADLQKRLRADHRDFYCPNGHNQYYSAKTEAEKLRDELAAAKRDAKFYAERSDRLANDNMTLARSRTALRGVVTRLKRKAIAGECAFCHQRFTDVAEHVAQEHPGVSTEAVEDGSDDICDADHQNGQTDAM